MYQIDVASAATTLPASSAAGTPGFFTDGNPATGVPATIVPAEFMNAVMLEILNVMAAASIAPAKGNHAQLLAAINAIVQNSVAPVAATDKAGVVELATAQEGIAGTDTVRAIVPAVLAAVLASYAKLASPAFTGTPTGPTAALGSNSQQLANTAFVQAAIAALVDSSPAALNTLNELAAALGDDPNFATTMTNALAGKQPLLGFTPIQQGGGANQGTNKLCIGWGNDTSLKLQVDSTDFGSTWPIGITGRAQGNYVLTSPVVLSGTAVDFTGIPTWVKRITLSFRRGSVSTASQLTIRIGSAGAVDASGYEGCVCSLLNGGSIGNSVLSDGFTLTNSIDANSDINGNVVLERMDATTWSMNSTLGRRGITYIHFTGGSKVLTGGISTVRITTVAGTASLTGSVSLTYEG